MPLDAYAYMKSGFRHFMDCWMNHRGVPAREDAEEAICALMFNAEGYLHELLKERPVGDGVTDDTAAVQSLYRKRTPCQHRWKPAEDVCELCGLTQTQVFLSEEH